jgi:hypothetical protein
VGNDAAFEIHGTSARPAGGSQLQVTPIFRAFEGGSEWLHLARCRRRPRQPRRPVIGEHLSPGECDRPARAAPRLAGVRKRSIRHSVERSVVGRQYCHRAGAGAGKTLASSIEAYLRRPGVKGSNAPLGEYWVLYYLHLPMQLFRRLSHMGVSPTWRKQYL